MRGAEARGAASSTPSGGHLLAVDPDVPGLPLLLDDAALTAWLCASCPGGGARAPQHPLRRTYVRLKPGAGGVARVDRGPGQEPAFVLVVSRDSVDKLAKTVGRGGDDVLLHDRAALAVLAGPGADRDLPGLVRLHRRGTRAALRGLQPVDDAARRLLRRCAVDPTPARALAWKPQRRWVGVLEDGGSPAVVLRAYRRGVAARAVRGYVVLGAAVPGAVPRLLGHDEARAVVAVEHLDGVPLDRVATSTHAVPSAETDALVAAGRLLARVHGAGAAMTGGAGVPGRPDEAAAVREAAALLELLVPGCGARELGARLGRALAALGAVERVLVHGDLSADQLLLRPDGRVALLDLDEVGAGPAGLDLASAAASWWAEAPELAPARVAALHEGYVGLGRLPGPDDLRVRTAALLLRRAPEPFRHGGPGWPAQVVARVRRAADLLEGQGRA